MSNRRRGPTKEWKVSLPVELALHLELLLVGPHNRKPSYGARSALVVGLLKQYWDNLPDQRKQEALQPNRQGDSP